MDGLGRGRNRRSGYARTRLLRQVRMVAYRLPVPVGPDRVAHPRNRLATGATRPVCPTRAGLAGFGRIPRAVLAHRVFPLPPPAPLVHAGQRRRPPGRFVPRRLRPGKGGPGNRRYASVFASFLALVTASTTSPTSIDSTDMTTRAVTTTAVGIRGTRPVSRKVKTSGVPIAAARTRVATLIVP